MFVLMTDRNEFSRVVAKVSWCQALNVEMCVYVCEKIGMQHYATPPKYKISQIFLVR